MDIKLTTNKANQPVSDMKSPGHQEWEGQS